MSYICVCVIDLVFRIINNTCHLRYNDSSKGVTADVDHSTEAVQKPIDGNDYTIHAADRDVDGAWKSQDLVNTTSYERDLPQIMTTSTKLELGIGVVPIEASVDSRTTIM